MIIDKYNRVHDYLRISLTDNCDLRCFYCMPEEEYQFTPPAQLMQPNEIEAIARVFVAAGVKKIRLTGGEPLVRKDCKEILERLGGLPVALTITTNGTLLHDYIPYLQKAGIRSLNLSLDTLQPEKFLFITKRDKHALVMRNINLLLQQEMHVKVNVVVVRGVNDDEIIDFARWTRDLPIQVRFIEFMPFDKNKWNQQKVISLQEIIQRVAAEFPIEPIERAPNETAKNYRIPGHKGQLAIISTMTSPFCGDCNRIRLTADGKMKNCLFSQAETDILGAFRRGEDILPLLHQNIQAKQPALGGQFTTAMDQIAADDLQNRSMIRIGG